MVKICAQTCVHEAKTCACMSTRACHNVRTHIYALYAQVFTQNFMKIALIVHYFVMTLSLKFLKDPTFCWGDMRKMMLNMHARVIYACSKFRYTCMHAFASCARWCAQIFTKKILLVHYFVENLSFKYHKDLIFRWGDIFKNLAMRFFFAATVFRFVVFFITSRGKNTEIGHYRSTASVWEPKSYRIRGRWHLRWLSGISVGEAS